MLDRRLESNGHGAGDADGSVPPLASSFETFRSVTSGPVGVRMQATAGTTPHGQIRWMVCPKTRSWISPSAR